MSLENFAHYNDLSPKLRLELEKKVIPLIVLRELPNGLIEKWKIFLEH